MTPQQENQIKELREQKLTPKQIARKLGLKVSQVSQALKEKAEKAGIERFEKGELDEIEECLVNSNCYQRLVLNEGEDQEEVGGLGLVWVARKKGYEKYEVCTYLIDYWCLGLKDTMGVRKMNGVEYRQMREIAYQGFPDDYCQIRLEQAQGIVYGAIQYAEELGLNPHRDFEKTKAHLGKWMGEPKLEFGREGKPLYVEGPYDNTAQILKTLKEKVGEKNYHYLAGLRSR